MEQRVRIEGTNDRDVACALAYLADFPKGSSVSRINNIYHRELNPECVVAFHEETLKAAGNDHPMTYLGPDLVVTQVYRPPRENEKEWQPTDEYTIDSGPRIDPSLFEKLEEQIRAGPPSNVSDK